MQAKWKVLAVTAVMGLSFGAAGCVVHDHGRSWRGGYGYYDGHRTGYGHHYRRHHDRHDRGDRHDWGRGGYRDGHRDWRR